MGRFRMSYVNATVYGSCAEAAGWLPAPLLRVPQISLADTAIGVNLKPSGGRDERVAVRGMVVNQSVVKPQLSWCLCTLVLVLLRDAEETHSCVFSLILPSDAKETQYCPLLAGCLTCVGDAAGSHPVSVVVIKLRVR
ncbi:hypothetical protein CBR_g19976 [Chara braunii]|uniref:Uncharacterized protein n=1 Tax=Chara braunii TaxID=69332 RepID=A0A388KZG6_CHABU|nr:hypothetical protein CBR_g19976 [Chara braunii]|eukprot:GBG75343.1 hypothetical protein CBR_g19976 [Chara braunii]